MPMVEYEERRAGVCAYLCISIATVETSDIPTGDCLAALSLAPRDRLSPPRKTLKLYQNPMVLGEIGNP